MIHESTQHPRSENRSPDMCILRITGLRSYICSKVTWRENNYICSKVTLQLSMAIRQDIRYVLDLARGIDIIDDIDRL